MYHSIKNVFIIVFVFLFISCNKNDDSKIENGPLQSSWPPAKVQTPPKDFRPTERLNYSDWINVKVGDQGRTAFVTHYGNVKLPFNLFAIKEPANGYAECQFEVIYYDETQTFVIADSTKNDKLAMIYNGVGDVSSAYTYPGTRIRYQSKYYEIREDGWYLDGKRVHAFILAYQKQKSK